MLQPAANAKSYYFDLVLQLGQIGPDSIILASEIGCGRGDC